MKYRVTISIDTSPEKVWDVISDVERWPEWTPTMSEIHRPGTGRLQVGSKADVRQPGQPRRVWVVTELEDGHSFTWQTGGSMLTFRAEHIVRPVDGHTEVALVFEIAGRAAAPVSLLARRKVAAMVDTEANSLKARCEKVQ